MRTKEPEIIKSNYDKLYSKIIEQYKNVCRMLKSEELTFNERKKMSVFRNTLIKKLQVYTIIGEILVLRLNVNYKEDYE